MDPRIGAPLMAPPSVRDVMTGTDVVRASDRAPEYIKDLQTYRQGTRDIPVRALILRLQ